MSKHKKTQDTIRNPEDGIANEYLKIEAGIYTAYATLDAGVLYATDALMIFCKKVFLGSSEDKEPPPKDKTK